MSNNSKLQPVRGTHDILPAEAAKHRFVTELARQRAQLYGYEEIHTPIFEFSEVFHRTLGESSDVVSKETYSFVDRGGDSITLRPEFTAAIARAFISNGLQQNLPCKFFYSGAAFRYERPQKGRLRQFHQLGVELLGDPTPQADIEIIALAWDIITNLGIADKVQLQLNSLGDATSRTKYRQALVEYLQQYEHKLSADSKQRLHKNPLRILDSKDHADREIIANAPELPQYFSESSKDFFAEVQAGLSDIGIAFTINDKLVRGLDYYCHTVFEFTCSELGAQNTILAGGRYDGLIELMGGPHTPGIGFAAGIERLIEVVNFTNHPMFTPPTRPVALIAIGNAAQQQALILAQAMRGQNIPIYIPNGGNLQKQLKKANKANAIAAIILGENELAKGVASLKDLDSGQQSEVKLCDLSTVLSAFID